MSETTSPTITQQKYLFDRNKLIKGETLVWEDRPAPAIIFLRPIALLIVALVYAGILLSYSGDFSTIIIALVLSAIMIPFDRRFGIIAAIAGAVVAFLVLFLGPSVVLLVAIPVIIGLIPAITTYLYWRNAVFAVTNLRAISQYGLFEKRVSSMNLNQVQLVSVKQPLLEKMFGFGDVYISSAADMGGLRERRAGLRLFTAGVAWDNVKRPFNVEKTLNESIYKPPAATTVVTPPTPSPTVESKMVELNNMKEKGLLTDAEYQSKREEILKRM